MAPNYGGQPQQFNQPPQFGQQPYMGGQQPYIGGQQPLMPGQLPMPNINQGNSKFIIIDKVIIIREHSSIPCRMCGYDGMSTWRQSAGCAVFSWCICLFCFTGIL